MEDVQFPPETGEAKSPPPRRAGMRLRDAETVAATRLDMFGDNSLRDALTGGPRNPAEGEAAGDAAAALAAELVVIDGAPGDADAPAAPVLAVVEAAPAPTFAPEIEILAEVQVPPEVEAPPMEPVGADVARDLAPVDIDAVPVGLPEPATLEVSERPSEPEWNGAGLAASPRPHESDSIEDLLVPREEAHGAGRLIGAAPTDAEAAVRSARANLEMPPFRDPAPPEPTPPPSLHDFSPPFPDAALEAGPTGPSGPPPFREELAPPAPVYDAAAPPPVFDPEAQIAAEADATQQALENLQRLLGTRLPDMEPEPPPVPPEREMLYSERPFGPRGFEPPPIAEGGLRFGPQAEGGLRIGPQTEAPMLAGTMAPMLPQPVPPERANRRGIYFLGFLSGLGLSLMTGIVLYFVLYFVINTTG